MSEVVEKTEVVKEKSAKQKKGAKKKEKTKEKNVYKLFTLNDEGNFSMVEMEMKHKMNFLKEFGTEQLPNKSELESWIEKQ